MWNWIKDHRRKKILEIPFPSDWEPYLERNISHYKLLQEDRKKHLRDLVQVFVAEKNWEGCAGLVMTNEIRVTIAGQACLLILELPHDLYSGVESVFVYPTAVVRPEHKLGVFERPQGITPVPYPILGEAQHRGPVILVWDSVKQMAQHPEAGHNVVYHEFAHKLDMIDGAVDGTPPLGSPALYQEWAEICSREFLKLRADSHKGRPTFLDSYCAVNEAEFFAVITEQFFDKPAGMKKHHPDLYSILQKFYRQDPEILYMARPS